VVLAGNAPLQSKLGTGHYSAGKGQQQVQTRAGRLSLKGVGADGPAHIHRYGKWGPWVGETRGWGCLRDARLRGQKALVTRHRKQSQNRTKAGQKQVYTRKIKSKDIYQELPIPFSEVFTKNQRNTKLQFIKK